MPTVTAEEARVAPLAALVGADLEVPLLGGGSARQANLDLAASAPALVRVADRVAALLPWYSSVHRGTGFPSEVVTDVVEEARRTVARRLGADLDDVVVFTRNTTDALNLLASAVPGEVVVLDIEHHANLLPWRERRVLVGHDTIEATLESLESELARRPAALVAITGASNVTGEVLPVARLAAIAHAYGARLAIDGAQLVPHRAFDLAASGADYVALSGHKAYAPYGAGALVGRRDWLDAAPAYLAGGGAVSHVELGRVEWCPAPARHEAGTPNVLGIAALAIALEELAGLDAGEGPGASAREAHERALIDRLAGGLVGLDGVRIVRGFADASEHVGILTVTLEHTSVGLVAAALSAEHGISVRAGKFCAHPFFRRVGGRANGLRASIGVGTSEDDVDRFTTAFARLVAEGPREEYHRTANGWRPLADDRPRPSLFGG